MREPSLVLADEPTAYLDYVQVEEVLRIVRELAAPGRVVVVATHDERLIPLADRAVELVPTAVPTNQASRSRELEAGEVLFEHGSQSDFVYVVDEGEIALLRERPDHSEEVIRTVGSGGYFGELGPMLRLPRSATARAVTRTRVTGYNARDFKQYAGMGNLESAAAHSTPNNGTRADEDGVVSCVSLVRRRRPPCSMTSRQAHTTHANRTGRD